MEILFLAPFALFAGILWDAWKLARIHVSDDAEPSRADDLPRDDSWVRDVERFDLLLTPHRRRGGAPKNAGNAASGIFRRCAAMTGRGWPHTMKGTEGGGRRGNAGGGSK